MLDPLKVGLLALASAAVWKGATLTGRCTHTFVDGRLVHELEKGGR